MTGWFPTLETTVTTLLPDWPALSAAERAVVGRHCAMFTRRQIALAPAHIRAGIWTLYGVFSAFSTLRSLRRGLSSPTSSATALAAFAALGPAPFAGLERVLRSMTLLAFLEHPHVLSAVGADPLDRDDTAL
jgi:hypothetical protein